MAFNKLQIMENNPLLISKPILLTLFILGFLMGFCGALFKILHFPGANNMLVLASIIQLIAWLVVLFDVLRNNIYNKFLWVISVILFGGIGSVVYILKRDKLLGRD